MSSETTGSGTARGLVGRFWNEVGNLPYSMAVFDDLVADVFAISTDDQVIEGKGAFRAWLQTFQSKISHLETVPEAMLVAEDGQHVTTRMRISGFNNGRWVRSPIRRPSRSSRSRSWNSGTDGSPTTGSKEAPSNSIRG